MALHGRINNVSQEEAIKEKDNAATRPACPDEERDGNLWLRIRPGGRRSEGTMRRQRRNVVVMRGANQKQN